MFLRIDAFSGLISKGRENLLSMLSTAKEIFKDIRIFKNLTILTVLVAALQNENADRPSQELIFLIKPILCVS
jgi:hypothetical protein